MNVRLREQLEGAIQATVVGLVVVVALVASHIQPWNFPAFRPMRTFVLLELAALALAYLVVTRARLRLLPGLAVVAAFTLLALLSALWSPDPSLTVDRAAGFAVLMVAAAALGLGAVDRPRVAGQLMLALLGRDDPDRTCRPVRLWHAYDQAVLPATKGQGARYSGIGQNPNQIPMLIALVLPFALWAVRESRGRARVVSTAVVLLLAGSLVASGSRGAVVAGFVGCLVYLLAVVPRRRALILAAGTALFVLAAVATQLPQPAAENSVLNDTFGRTERLGPKDLNDQLPLESEFGFPGAGVETDKERTLFFTSGRLQAWETAADPGARAADRRVRVRHRGRGRIVDRPRVHVGLAGGGELLHRGLPPARSGGRRAGPLRARAAARSLVARAIEARSRRRRTVCGRVRRRGGRRGRPRGAAVLPHRGRQPAYRGVLGCVLFLLAALAVSSPAARRRSSSRAELEWFSVREATLWTVTLPISRPPT